MRVVLRASKEARCIMVARKILHQCGNRGYVNKSWTFLYIKHARGGDGMWTSSSYIILIIHKIIFASFELG